jgi:HAD superfamily hydrolase (TIGR01549 family)
VTGGALPDPSAGWPRLLTVLLVSGGGFQGQAPIRALRQIERVRIVLADCHAENAGRLFVDAFHQVPPIQEREAFLAALHQVCQAEGVRLIVPSTDHELEVLAEQRTVFERAGVQVAVSEPAFLETCRNKRALYPALRAAGLPALAHVDPRDPDAPYPLIAKPARSWGSRDLVVLRSREALHPGLLETHVFQPCLEGFEELSVDFSIDLTGRPSELGTRRRVRVSGGFAVVSENLEDPEAERLAARFAELASTQGGRGLFNIQLLRHRGMLYLSDVNPRMGTSAVHWCGVGFEPIRHLLESVDPTLARKAPPERPWPRRRMLRHLSESWRDAEPACRSSPLGVVFDLDDTLLDHKAWILARLENAHQALSGRLPERAAFLLEAIGVLEEGGPRRLIDELAERLGMDEAARQDLLEAYRAAIPEQATLFDDVWPTLEGLRRAGLRLGLVTDNPRPTQQRKIDRCGLLPWLDAIVFARDEGGEKPEPGAFVACARRLDLPPSRLAMVGDNPYRDIVGARRAGYGHAYLIRREGTLRRFSSELLRRLRPALAPDAVLEGLRGLVPELLDRRPA